MKKSGAFTGRTACDDDIYIIVRFEFRKASGLPQFLVQLSLLRCESSTSSEFCHGFFAALMHHLSELLLGKVISSKGCRMFWGDCNETI